MTITFHIPEILAQIFFWSFAAMALFAVLFAFAKCPIIRLESLYWSTWFYIFMVCTSKKRKHLTVDSLRNLVRQLREDGDTEMEKRLENIFKCN